jgi:hypothetical protein
VCVPERGVGDLDGDSLPQVRGESLRTKIKKTLPRALGRRDIEIDANRSFEPGI